MGYHSIRVALFYVKLKSCNIIYWEFYNLLNTEFAVVVEKWKLIPKCSIIQRLDCRRGSYNKFSVDAFIWISQECIF